MAITPTFWQVTTADPIDIGNDELTFEAVYGAQQTAVPLTYPVTTREAAAGLVAGTVAGTVMDDTKLPGDVRRYGAVENEAATATTSVNTAAIQAALNSNGYVWFQPGETYMTGMLIPNNNNTIDLNGATLMMLAGVDDNTAVIRISPRYGGSSTYYDPAITLRENVRVINGTIDGNRVNQTGHTNPVATCVHYNAGYDPSTSDHGLNAFSIEYEVDGVWIENVNAVNCWTDGAHVYRVVGEYPKNIIWTDVLFDNNGRQGLSIVGGNYLRHTRCTFSNTNQSGLPLGPWAGVDIEPYEDLKNITFTDCIFRDNDGRGLTVLMSSESQLYGLFVENCLMQDNGQGNTDLENALGGGVRAGVHDVLFSNCVINERISVQPSASSKIATTLALAAVALDPTITVVDDTEIADGDEIGVALDSGARHWTTVSGPPVANVVTLTDVMPSAAAIGKDIYNEALMLTAGVSFSNCVIGYDETYDGTYSAGALLIRDNNRDSEVLLTGCRLRGDRDNVNTGILDAAACVGSKLTVSGCHIINRSVGTSAVGAFLTSGDGYEGEVTINGTIIEAARYPVRSGDGNTYVNIGGGSVLRAFGGASSIGYWNYSTNNPRGDIVVLSDVQIEGCNQGVVKGGPAAATTGTVSVNGSRFVNCTTNTVGLNGTSEFRGPSTNPGTDAIKAGMGSIYQSTTDGSVWRNTDGATAWTAM